MEISEIHSLEMKIVQNGRPALRDCQVIAGASASIDSGDPRICWLLFEAGSMIGPHPATFPESLTPVAGSGWAAGVDGQRREITPGTAVRFAQGEVRSLGSETGMCALMDRGYRK
jgi:hypothetical protein